MRSRPYHRGAAATHRCPLVYARYMADDQGQQQNLQWARERRDCKRPSWIEGHESGTTVGKDADAAAGGAREANVQAAMGTAARGGPRE